MYKQKEEIRKMNKMRSLFIIAVILGFLCFLAVILAQAEDTGQGEGMRRYQDASFGAVDTNQDGVLDQQEIQAARSKFPVLYGERMTERTDTNGDGIITKEEADAQKQWAKDSLQELRERRQQYRQDSNSDESGIYSQEEEGN
jgi:hypothetical protein